MGSLNRFSGGVALVALAVLASLAGCSDSNPRTYPLSGSVTLDGQPLEGAAIMLKPVNGGSNGYGVADAEGRFEITTYRQGDGALGGEHRIIVSLAAIAPVAEGESGEPQQEEGEEEGEEESLDDGTELATSNQFEMTSLVPERYTDFETSGLTVLVGPENGPLRLELTLQE